MQGLKNPDLDHRMEYFDPKTRPQAIFLDEEALLSAPPDLMRSTATTVFASNVVAMSQTDINPLAEASRNHAFRLAFRAYPRLVEEMDNPSMRMDFAVAALLQDRAEDDGLRRYPWWCVCRQLLDFDGAARAVSACRAGQVDLGRACNENPADREDRCAIGTAGR